MNFSALTLDALALLSLDDLAEFSLNPMNDSSPLPTLVTLADANAIASRLPGLAVFRALSADDRTAYLAAATDRVIASRPWQGCKVDPCQVLPFPRYRSRPYPYQFGSGNGVWDLDAITGEPIVPLDVRKATIYEADSLAAGTRSDRQQAIHDGLAGQSTGSLSETYRTDARGVPLLCQAADVLLRKYTRTSAALS